MKKRTSRLVAITLALVLCLSMIPVMAWAASIDDRERNVQYVFVPGQTLTVNPVPGPNDNGRHPHGFGREEVPVEPEKVPEKEPAKEPEKQPEKQPEKPMDDAGRIVTERFIKLIETGRGFEELWSNRESPVWTLGDIENYLARRAGRIPTAGVGFIAHP